jgi:hypothetical protein
MASNNKIVALQSSCQVSVNVGLGAANHRENHRRPIALILAVQRFRQFFREKSRQAKFPRTAAIPHSVDLPRS